MKQAIIIASVVLIIWVFLSHGGAEYINNFLISGTTHYVENSGPMKQIESGLNNPTQHF